MVEETWWMRVLEFAMNMIIRFEAIEKQRGWTNYDSIKESEYRKRAIKNIKERHYVDAANLCLLAERIASK